MLLPDRAETEVWFRNPGYYIQQLAEVGCYNIVFDAGYIGRKKIDPQVFCYQYFGFDKTWRCIVIHPNQATLYESGVTKPTAVWPVWSATSDPISKLVKFIKNPWGENKKLCSDTTVTINECPVLGQRHIIVITDLPLLQQNSSKLFMSDLSDFQEEHPEVTFFIHGSYSYPTLFGNSFKMCDIDARTAASKGNINIPVGGRALPPTHWKDNQYWFEILGYTMRELNESPAARCIYNIKSAIFAGTYWKHLRRFAVQKKQGIGINNSMMEWNTPQMETHIKENSLVFTKRLVVRPGDRILCDDCSLWMSCKYYRESAVCIVPESDMTAVAELFGTRDSTNIQKALTRLVQANTERIERGMRAESTPISRKDGEESIEREVDPALSKLITDTFKMGDRLLQIVDPAMRPGKSGVTVAVNGTGQRVEITQGNRDDQQMVSHVITMLEARGFTRDQITEDMVRMALQEMAGVSQPQAITGEVVQ
jgi:hypothetical protein